MSSTRRLWIVDSIVHDYQNNSITEAIEALIKRIGYDPKINNLELVLIKNRRTW